MINLQQVKMMTQIKLEFPDNKKCKLDFELPSETLDDISIIQGKTVEELCKNYSDLLVFPYLFDKTEYKINESMIYSVRGSLFPDNYRKSELQTYNLMGYMGINQTQLKIYSRFCDNDFFLMYMLEKVFSINLFNLQTTFSQGNLDLLPFIFSYYLKKVFSKGLYKEYRRFKKNDCRVNGSIDIPRHIRLNRPFNGKIAYSFREITYDNYVMHLVRHTVNYLKNSDYKIVLSDNKIREIICIIKEVTPSFDKTPISTIISKNIKPISSFFYSDFKILQRLCLCILRQKKVSLSNDSSKKIYGLLFDGAWLWEEYLATVLTKIKPPFVHSKNKVKENGINIYKGKKYYPDFYRGIQLDTNQSQSLNNNFVLDAKYKKLFNGNSVNYNREDIHQMVTYMHILPASKGWFIYPVKAREDLYKIIMASSKKLYGFGGELSSLGIMIPKSDSFNSFKEKMHIIEEELTEFVNKTDLLTDNIINVEES